MKFKNFQLGIAPNKQLSIKPIFILMMLLLGPLFLFSQSNPNTSVIEQGKAVFSSSDQTIKLDKTQSLVSEYKVDASEELRSTSIDLTAFCKLMTDSTIEFKYDETEETIQIKILNPNPVLKEKWTVSDWNNHLASKAQRTKMVLSNQ